MQDMAKQLVVDLELGKKKIWDDEPEKRTLLQDIHVIYGRAKDPEHLVEKIIRKIGIEDSQKYNEINVGNYFDILRDLIGVRIIVIKKEGWKAAHELLCSLFETFYDNTPKAYVCYGDRKIFDERSISELDDMISTCMQLDGEILEKLNQKFEKDSYVDWAKEQFGSQGFTDEEQISMIENGDINDIIGNKLL